jgi:Flp pilus assembly protein TadD
MALKEFALAESLFQKALALSPDHTPALNDLAVLLMDQDRQAEARQLLERALELNPNDTLAQQNLERLGAQ